MAHSLGFPHPNLMLRQITLAEYQELLMYFDIEDQRKSKLNQKISEIKLTAFMDAKIAAQKTNG